MAKRIIRTGTTVDPTGDSLKNAFTKVNDNFTEIYNALGLDENTLNIGAFEFNGSTMSTTDSSSIVIDQATTITSNLEVGGDILPSMANGGDLGSLSKPFKSLYVSNSTIYFGGTPLSVNQDGNILIDGNVYGGGGSSNRLTNGTKVVSLEAEGKLTLPAGTTFEYLNTPLTGHGDGLARLDFSLATDGVITEWMAASANPAGSGYSPGDTFTFDAAFLGIPGASVTIEVLTVGLGGSVENLGFTPGPLYPADIYRDSPVNLQVGAESNRWSFKADGTLAVPGAIKQGINKLDLNENNNGNVYLTVTADDTTAVFMTPTGIQTYARETVSLQVGAGLNELSATHSLLEAEWVNAREADAFTAAPTIREWQGLESWLAYPILLNSSPDLDPPMAGNLPTIANAAKNAYNLWQAAIADTGIGITVGNNTWAFAPSGTLTLPEPANVNFDAPSIRFGGATSVATNNYGFGVPGPAAGVVYNATTINLASMKLLVTIEGQEDGGDGLNHTQVCEMLVVRRTGLTVSIVDSVVYGVLHTSLAPLATLTAQLSVDGRVEILAQPTNTTAIYVKVYATEVVRGD